MKNYFLPIFLLCCSIVATAQKKQDLYFLLKKGQYTKKDITRFVTIKTNRRDTAYSFSIPCNCAPLELSFLHLTNPEIGKISKKTVKIDKKELKKIKLITLDSLVLTMKRHDTYFNDEFNLYLIEKDKLITVYPVFKMTSFGDYQPDAISNK